MVFIMPASSIAKLLLLLIISMPVYAETFSVDYARITKTGNGYVLNARIDYPLTLRVKEAIANSVPIVFSQQIKLVRQTPLLGKYWIWERTSWLTELRYEIRYHALSQQYIVRDLGTQNQNTYPSLSDALQALGSVYLSLPPDHMVETQNLSLQIRSELDLYALPTPMRPGALLSKKWQLASPWVTAQWD
ncbi:MAG: DUF4390 domain-containing protein [Methylophaga sp.]|nr:DUF4390 domain-containing protein [Methylophaga sp.]